IEEESEEEDERPTQRARGRVQAADSDDESEEAEEGEGVDAGGNGEADSQDQVVKKLVRYALACEFQRIPIKRTGISERVLGNNKKVGSFKRVFEAAQKILRTKFGMEMVELPGRDKVSMKDKRAASKAKRTAKATTSSYILITTLPIAYRVPEIIAPSLIESEEEEAAYVALCTVIVSYISMNPNEAVADHKFMRFLRRLNVEENTPIDKTTVVLAKMMKHGYIWKFHDKQADGEEQIDWRVGPRGKAEIGNMGISGFVKTVWGDDAPEDLDKRLQRSLGMEVRSTEANETNGVEAAPVEEANGRAGPSRRRRGDDD
ncbi:hypothetical protein HYFRA_00014123, partial [Hymenoscyphus fraxineus]